ncbi:MAG: argininosuccinate lyase [Candidatus Korobacteraceae bacterium]
MKMWSGRFREPLNPQFERWQRSFPFDQQLLAEELAASRAHALALHAAGVLTAAERDAILGGLEYIGLHGDDLRREETEAEDVHHFVEKQLTQAIGETGLKLHTGRSRNEQIATDLRLFVRNSCRQLATALEELIAALLAQARQADTAAMPAYTHMQRAEPVLVAHWLLAYCEMFFRDIDRLGDCEARLNYCPLGSGAVAGATIRLDRQMMARELGFAAPTGNSLDATSDRDFCLEFAQVLSILAIHLSRLAEEFILFSTQEYGFITLPESYSTGSSAMPQKQNPDSLELIRGKSARILACAQSLLICLKGLPLAYNKDMQETQKPVFTAAREAAAMLEVAAGFMREVQLNLVHMNTEAQTGNMNAMAAATYLTGKGVPFRRAHELVGQAVRKALARYCELQELPLAELRQLSPEFDADFYDAITLSAVLACIYVVGGSAPHQVTRALEEADQRLKCGLVLVHVGA